MKVAKVFENEKQSLAHSWIRSWLAAALFIVLAAASVAQQPDARDGPGPEVLTRGPVHEAFAEVVTYNPEPGVIVSKAPPAPIEEVPPDEKPDGDNVAWIPGYWSWDDERNDFLWISGTWRVLPPGREWRSGYWAQSSQGHQWISGYWGDTAAEVTTYLPPPPETLEVGPNTAAPSIDYVWSPGCWVWQSERYAWRPGYWDLGRPDWTWIPARYSWTPRGCVFVGGYWDYPVVRRGVLFAPVYFTPAVYARRSFYSPSIVINVNVFNEHLFLRPRYHHYYFGDYYAPRYTQVGFYASFSFHSSHRGYDPFYTHRRWEHRRDRDWDRQVRTNYEYRRDHDEARPPRTWVAQRSISTSRPEFQRHRQAVATPFDQLTRSRDNPLKFHAVAREEKQVVVQRRQEVERFREERRTVEAKAVETTARRTEAASEPAKVRLPRSPIVATPVNRLERAQAPPPSPRTPSPDLQRQPRPQSPGRTATGEQRPQSETRRAEPEKRTTPGRSEVPRARQAPPQTERRTTEMQRQAEPQRRVEPSPQAEPRRQTEPPRRSESSRPAESPRVEPQRPARAQPQVQSSGRAEPSARQVEPQRRVEVQNPGPAKRPASRTPDVPERKVQQESKRPVTVRSNQEKGASQLLKRDDRKKAGE